MNKPLIYLDNNATTAIDSRVLEQMMPFLTSNYANANSTHLFGVDAHEAVKASRSKVAQIIGAESNEIVFTSGATEAINLAIKGLAENTDKKHIITTSTEHNAVLDTCKYLEKKGFEITYLPVGKDGLIDIEEFKLSLRSNTLMACVMYVNNETGVIQPIKELANLTHDSGAYFMTDGTQAVGKMPIKVDELGIDLMCFSGHKIYAPKGIGALYIRKRGNKVKLPALIHGGGHEFGLRSGTLNVPGIVALGSACEIAHKEMAKNAKNIEFLRNELESSLLEISGTSINGSIQHRLYNVTNILFKGADSDAIIMGLSNPEESHPLIAVSNGSACTSQDITPSHVLTAMGLNETDAFSSIRFSIGKYNSPGEIEIVVDLVKDIVSRLRQMST